MTTPDTQAAPDYHAYIGIDVLLNGFVFERRFYPDINSLTLVLRQKYQKAHAQIGVTDPEVRPNLDPDERLPPGMA